MSIPAALYYAFTGKEPVAKPVARMVRETVIKELREWVASVLWLLWMYDAMGE